MKELKLETCPFCCSDEVILVEVNLSGTYRYSVKCLDCGSSTANFKTSVSATTRWNAREKKSVPLLKDFS